MRPGYLPRARRKSCAPRLALITVRTTKRFYLHSLQIIHKSAFVGS
jgi:hypothetical protein